MCKPATMRAVINQIRFVFFTPAAIHDLTGSRIRVFPNPVHNKVNIRIESATRTRGRIAIFNQYGAMVTEIDATSGDLQIDLSDLPRGLYYIEYFNGLNGICPSRIIKFQDE